MTQQIMNVQSSMILVQKIGAFRLSYRRLVAWSLEVSLVAISAAVPWALGQYVLVTERTVLTPPMEKTTAEQVMVTSDLDYVDGSVTLNPIVQYVQKGWAHVIQIPPHQLPHNVPRLTNIFWSVALITPVFVTVGQFVQLSSTGCTWARRWLGVQIISTLNERLHPRQILVRELVRWGLPCAVVGGITLVLGISLGPWTPVVIGVLVITEGMTAAAFGKRAWHDHIAKTRVTRAIAGYLPMVRKALVSSASGSESLNSNLTSQGNPVVQLYGETANDDDWWLMEADGELTSVVLLPRSYLAQKSSAPGEQLVLSTSVSDQRGWWVVGGMLLACTIGFGLGRATQVPATVQTDNDAFLEFAQQFMQFQSSGDHNNAVLMLAQVDDPRIPHYLTDLLSQSSQPETLAALQQALVSQGLDSLPFLLVLSRILESDLQQPLDRDIRHIRLEQRHVVQGAIAKLLAVYSNQLAGTKLDRVNLGLSHDPERAFRLIQPGLLAAGTSWQGANLSYANLAGASFFDVGIDGKPNSYDDIVSDLSGTDLVAASLEQANLQGARFNNADLRRADLRDANLTYGSFDQAQLTNARLVHVNAPQSRWQGSNLVGADLTQATFNEADFSQARLNRIEASHSSWTKAILPQSNWVGANLIGADFSQANLTSANLQGANLDSVDFTRANLRQANLRDTDLRQANLTGVNLTDADLAGAIFNDGRNMNDSFITPNVQLSETNYLRGVNFSRVRNLDRRQLNYICIQGGIHPTCKDVVDKVNND